MSPLLQLLTARPFPIPPGIGRLHTTDDDDVPAETGFCPKCRRELPEDAFYVRADGRTSAWCKACTREKSRSIRQAKNGVQS